MTDSRETKRTVPVPSAPTDGEQPNSQICTTASISEAATENNPQEKSLEERLLEMRRMTDPAYLPTISMNELYQNVYQSRPPIIDGLLCSGTYLFAGRPRWANRSWWPSSPTTSAPGRSYGSMRSGLTVLYLALEERLPAAARADVPNVRCGGNRQALLRHLCQTAWQRPG